MTERIADTEPDSPATGAGPVRELLQPEEEIAVRQALYPIFKGFHVDPAWVNILTRTIRNDPTIRGLFADWIAALQDSPATGEGLDAATAADGWVALTRVADVLVPGVRHDFGLEAARLLDGLGWRLVPVAATTLDPGEAVRDAE